MSNVSDLVVVERMPEHLRGSHRAAGNWGTYPHNGAERHVEERSDAEDACAGDEYDHIVRAASVSDHARYGTGAAGMRVRSVGAGDNDECGVLRRVVDAHTIEVGWDSGVVTEHAARDLRWAP